MTDQLKNWVENGEHAEMGAKLIAESMEGNYYLRTESAAIVLHPRLGLFAVTKYGAIFSVPDNIERIAIRWGNLCVYTKANLKFVYDLRTGELIEIAEE